MEKNNTEVEVFSGDIEKLADSVFKMRPDKIAEFLYFGMKEFYRQREFQTKTGNDGNARLILIILYKLGESVLAVMNLFAKNEYEINKNKNGGS